MSKKPPVRKPAPASKPVVQKAANVFLQAEKYLEKNQRKFLLLMPLIIGAFFAILTFDIKISEGNDDAMYIEAATKYAADFTGYYYTANAPFYPMMLGIVTMITGFNLVIYKLINTVLFLTHLLVMYFAFRRRLPYLVLLPVLLLSAVNSYYLYYASQTYTEMLFVTLQGIFFWVFFTWQDRISGSVYSEGSWQLLSQNVLSTVPPKSIMPRIKGLLAIGLSLFLITFCKNIAIGALGAIMLFFILTRNWRSMGDAVAGYLLVRLSFEGIKSFIWGASNQYGSQGAILLQKDAYNPAAGQEDISGFISRFFQNFNIYTSKRIFQVLGFRDPDSTEVHGILSLLALVLLVFAAYQIWKNFKSGESASPKATSSNRILVWSKSMMLVLIYVVTMLSLTYLVLQVKWDQPRLIMVYVPLLVMVIFFGFYSYFSKGEGSGRAGMAGYLTIVILVVGSSLLTTVKKSIANYPVLKKNLQGDIYYGYTPDWENFLRLSAWCADSLPPGSYVASRKAPMSFVYAKGKPFFPVYTVPAVDTTTNLSNPDSVLALFKENKVTHVLMGSLRRNPKKPDGYVINTLHRMMQPVATKYPDKIKLIKQIGDTEPAYLYEIKE